MDKTIRLNTHNITCPLVRICLHFTILSSAPLPTYVSSHLAYLSPPLPPLTMPTPVSLACYFSAPSPLSISPSPHPLATSFLSTLSQLPSHFPSNYIASSCFYASASSCTISHRVPAPSSELRKITDRALLRHFPSVVLVVKVK